MRPNIQRDDSDNSGTVSKDELQKAIEKTGAYSTPATIQMMLASADKNGDGLLSKEEFREAMLGKK